MDTLAIFQKNYNFYMEHTIQTVCVHLKNARRHLIVPNTRHVFSVALVVTIHEPPYENLAIQRANAMDFSTKT